MTDDKQRRAAESRRPRRRVARTVLALVIFAVVATASALAWAPKTTEQPRADSGSIPLPDPHATVVAQSAVHEHGGPSSEVAHAGVHEHGAAATARAAHIRLWDEREALLFSTWPGEEGALQHVDPANKPVGIVNWTGVEGIVGTRPFWEPVVPMFSLAPPNATVELSNYTIPPTTLGEVTIPRTIDVPLSGTLLRGEADKILGKNVTTDDRVYFLGQIPLRIARADNETVSYEFDLAEPMTFNVTRSVGLQSTATTFPTEGIVRFAFTAPSGSFTAHNNCALATKYLEPGYYVVREEDEERLVLSRYNNQVERIIEGATVHLQVTFLDGAELSDDETAGLPGETQI